MVKSSPDERGPDNGEDTFTRFEFGPDDPFMEHVGERRNAELCPEASLGIVERILKEVIRWRQVRNNREMILNDTEAHQNLSFGGYLVGAPDVLEIYIKKAVLFSELYPSGWYKLEDLGAFLDSEACKKPEPKNTELVELLVLMTLRAQAINLESRATGVVEQYPRAASMVSGEPPMLMTPVMLDGGVSTDMQELTQRIKQMQAYFEVLGDAFDAGKV